jgi:hypothetical protein
MGWWATKSENEAIFSNPGVTLPTSGLPWNGFHPGIAPWFVIPMRHHPLPGIHLMTEATG